jgi:hypothetical protein
MRAAAALALAVAALAGCGTPSPDLFVVTRTGTVPGADLRLLVSDTTVRCNGGDARALSSAQILDARSLHDDLLELFAAGRVPAAARGRIFSFAVRTEKGTLRFGDVTARPEVLPRVVQFTRDVARGVCGLPR